MTTEWSLSAHVISSPLSVYLLAPPRSANWPLLLHWACGRSDHPRPGLHHHNLKHWTRLWTGRTWVRQSTIQSTGSASCPITHSVSQRRSTRSKVWQWGGRNLPCWEQSTERKSPQCPLFNILPMKQSKQWTAVSLEESYFKGREAKSFQPRPLPSPPLPPQLLLTALIYSRSLPLCGWVYFSLASPSVAKRRWSFQEVLVPGLPLCYNCFPPCSCHTWAHLHAGWLHFVSQPHTEFRKRQALPANLASWGMSFLWTL